MVIGSLKDDVELNYNETLHLFSTDAGPLTLADVRALDAAGAIRWRYIEYRDWMRDLDEETFSRAFEESFGRISPDSMDPESYIRLHTLKDDSYLYGRIVDEDNSGPTSPQAVLSKSFTVSSDPRQLVNSARHGSAVQEALARARRSAPDVNAIQRNSADTQKVADTARKDAEKTTQDISAGHDLPSKEEEPPKRIDASTAKDIAHLAKELGIPVIFDDMTNLPHPVRLVPQGLGGLFYKIFGFEKADKELGYRIIRDVSEMQKPLDYQLEDEELPEDPVIAPRVRRNNPEEETAREKAAASTKKPGVRERHSRFRRKADEEQGRGKDTLQAKDQKGLGDPLKDVNTDYSSQHNKDELNMFS